jgi:MoaA/NifB/PqqE/SkfB family radical SAM enzyme
VTKEIIALANFVFSLSTLKKLAALFRDHRPGQIVNALRFGYHALRGFPAIHLPYDPLWLVLDITSRCNLHCDHCPYGNPESPRKPLQFRDMTMDTFARILDRFPRTIVIGLGGGEPLLNSHVLEMIQLAHERRIKVRIPTNGTLLSGNIDAFLAAPLEFLSVSLYGTDAASFAQLTGAKGSLFDDIIGAVAELAHRRLPGGYPRILRTSFICTKQTMSRALDFIRLCEELGVDEVKLRNLYYFGIPGYGEPMCLHEDDPEVADFIENLRRQRFRIPVFLPRLYRSNYIPRQCITPFQQLNIGGDGSIGPCCVMGPDKRWGSFLDPDVWNGPTMTQTRRNLRDVTYPLPPGCLHCERMIPEQTSI